MATVNPITSGLPAYVEQHIAPLLTKSILGAKSAKMMNLLTGVKGDAALNIMSNDVILQDASACGWSESGSTDFSQRVLNGKYLKVNMAFCDKKLLKTWAQHEVKIAAGIKNLPFEEEWTNNITDQVAAAVEKMIYQGASGATNEFEGLISILSGATGVVKVEKASGTSVYTALKEVYLSIPEEEINHEDCAILVGPATFRSFIQELVAANLYHFEPNDVEGEYKLPGTGVKVISVPGLAGTTGADYIIAGRLSNMFYGTDLEGDEEKFDLFYDKSNQEFRLVIEFLAGVQVAFPDRVVLGSIAKGA